MTNEHPRLQTDESGTCLWKKWGPYLSERQWGTVREDYSENGDAWNFFPHDHARSKAYRWGEDGIAGISDDKQLLCFALALWNGKDPILKERLFGLSGHEGNHGEDVKEYYYYLDSTPSHSYMKYLYKYPQESFPYEDLVRANINRDKSSLEYELLDTEIFSDDKYFDAYIEYAKNDPEDILICITVINRGKEKSLVKVIPQLWFRNFWYDDDTVEKPLLKAQICDRGKKEVEVHHEVLGMYTMIYEGNPELLFTENETNHQRISGAPNAAPYVKDGINDYIVYNRKEAVNSDGTGTKCAALYTFDVEGGAQVEIRLRLAKIKDKPNTGFSNFTAILRQRSIEADEFYETLYPPELSEDGKRIMRQALGGMLWTKQYYNYDVNKWLDQHDEPGGTTNRNAQWKHMLVEDIISMPDKWEYPWFAVWDTAFHTLALEMVDAEFAKHQLKVFLDEKYIHPSGQIPAYEWNFGDVNPPVHAFAAIFLYKMDMEKNRGIGDVSFLQYCFDGLEKNFNWWINHKDPTGENVFAGGFLGLDNIGVFDRSQSLPTGGHLEQSDGNGWMALYAQNMFEIALELAQHDHTHDKKVIKYFNHFLKIGAAMDRIGINDDEMWDSEDGFFYDVLRFPDGNATRLKVRSLVGLLPLAAVTVIERDHLQAIPSLGRRFEEIQHTTKKLSKNIACPETPGVNGRHMLAICNEEKLRSILSYMLDEDEFLSPYGIRSLSKYHAEHPYTFHWCGQEYSVGYQPGESDSYMFGGNSNWRGPIWMPANIIIIRALIHHYAYYGNRFRIECPTGSGTFMDLFQIAEEISSRLLKIFLRNKNGERPFNGGVDKFQTDPHWKDHLLFYEYFHGDNGAGIGASHQTGWTGNIAILISLFGSPDKKAALGRQDGSYQEKVTRRVAH